MDTSRDFVFQSPTFDFVLGAGRSVPQPTGKECAHILLALTEELSQCGVLHEVVGNRPIFSSSSNHGIWELEKGLNNWKDQYQGVRALEVVSWSENSLLNGVNSETCKIYIGTKGRVAYWFFLRLHNHRSAQSGVIECYEMDDDAMVRLFSVYRWEGSQSTLPRRVLGELIDLTNKALSDRLSRVEKTRSALSMMQGVADRLDSAEYDKASHAGTGIEG